MNKSKKSTIHGESLVSPLNERLNSGHQGQSDGGAELIQPKKVRGTPTMYAHLQFPTSSNYGSMKRRRSRERETDYVKIKFNPSRAERAEL